MLTACLLPSEFRLHNENRDIFIFTNLFPKPGRETGALIKVCLPLRNFKRDKLDKSLLL